MLTKFKSVFAFFAICLSSGISIADTSAEADGYYKALEKSCKENVQQNKPMPYGIINKIKCTDLVTSSANVNCDPRAQVIINNMQPINEFIIEEKEIRSLNGKNTTELYGTNAWMLIDENRQAVVLLDKTCNLLAEIPNR